MCSSDMTNIGPQFTAEASKIVSLAIPELNKAPLLTPSTLTISSNINKIETVEVTFSAMDHPNAGDLEIILTSPDGTQSILAQTHQCYEKRWDGEKYVFIAVQCNATYEHWTFSSVRHLGESADGEWTLTVKDGTAGNTGTFQSWKLKVYGHADP